MTPRSLRIPVVAYADCGTAGLSLLPEAFVRYDIDDPYAIVLELGTPDGHKHLWRFARELLLTGVLLDASHEPVGDGDVRIGADAADPSRVAIELNPPSGYARLLFPRHHLDNALDRSIELVPLGSESSRYEQLDEEIAALLCGGTP